ncbi:P53-mediated apoptosis protein ei24/pig8, partial [Globisporangium splendens]
MLSFLLHNCLSASRRTENKEEEEGRDDARGGAELSVPRVLRRRAARDLAAPYPALLSELAPHLRLQRQGTSSGVDAVMHSRRTPSTDLCLLSGQAEDVRDRVDGFVFLLYQVLWMYPIYCISFILNTIWYQEIADDAYLQLHGKPNPTPVADMIRYGRVAEPYMRAAMLDMLDMLFSLAFFLLQTVLSYLIPVIGPVTSFIHLSWLYSLYCFEYKWSLAGWSLEKRLGHLEQNWAYFAGFGSPFTLATFFVPNFVSKGIFALLFPVNLRVLFLAYPSAFSAGSVRISITVGIIYPPLADKPAAQYRRNKQRKKQTAQSTNMAEAYTVSKMLSSFNEVAPVATDPSVSVSLKRKMDNGVMLDTSEKEIAYLDMKARVKHSAQKVVKLDCEEKAKWIEDQRLKGNDLFHDQEYAKAADSYIQALTALDFGSIPEEKAACQLNLQLPLACNLTACMLLMEVPMEKARQMCTEALKINPNMTVSCLEKQLVDVERAERKHKQQILEQKRFQKKMMQEAVGRLYRDKKEVTMSSSSTSTNEDGIPCSRWSLGGFYALLLQLAAMVGAFLTRLFQRQQKKLKEL